MVAGDPVEGDHAVVGRAEALAAVCDGREGAEEGGEDGLEVAVGGEEGEGAVGEADAGEGGEKGAAIADDLEVGG